LQHKNISSLKILNFKRMLLMTKKKKNPLGESRQDGGIQIPMIQTFNLG
jgi:hypothetical protein